MPRPSSSEPAGAGQYRRLSGRSSYFSGKGKLRIISIAGVVDTVKCSLRCNAAGSDPTKIKLKQGRRSAHVDIITEVLPHASEQVRWRGNDPAAED